MGEAGKSFKKTLNHNASPGKKVTNFTHIDVGHKKHGSTVIPKAEPANGAPPGVEPSTRTNPKKDSGPPNN